MDIIKLVYEAFEKHGIWFIIQLIMLLIVGGGLFLLFLWIKKLISKDKSNTGVNVVVNIDNDVNKQFINKISIINILFIANKQLIDPL